MIKMMDVENEESGFMTIWDPEILPPWDALFLQLIQLLINAKEDVGDDHD